MTGRTLDLPPEIRATVQRRAARVEAERAELRRYSPAVRAAFEQNIGSLGRTVVTIQSIEREG